MSLILVHSPKGGVGSTFITAQLALHLAQRGREVAAIDFTYQESLKLHFGLRPVQTITDMADVNVDALVVSGVALMNGHLSGRDPAFRHGLKSGDVPSFSQNRITIADISSGDRELKDLLLPHAVLHICVLVPGPAALAVLPRIQLGTPTIALPKTVFVLNQIDDRLRLSRDTHSFIRDLFKDKLIGTVRRDEAVNEALAMFEPVARYAPSSVALPDLMRLTDAVEARCALPDIDANTGALRINS